MWHEQVPIDRPHAPMPWASPPDQKAGGVVASGKGHCRGKASNIVVVSPTLRIEEAAARLGCSPMDLWNLIHRGECPGLRRLDRYCVDESALDQVLEVLTRPESTANSPNYY